MLNFLWGLAEELFDFLTDVLFVRYIRRARGQPQRPFGEDAANLAIVNWIELPLACVAAVLVGFGMSALGVPTLLCVAVPAVAVLVFGVRRYRKRMDL